MHPFFNVIPGRVGKYQVESNTFFHPRLRSETPMVIVAKPEMTLRLLFRVGAVGMELALTRHAKPKTVSQGT